MPHAFPTIRLTAGVGTGKPIPGPTRRWVDPGVAFDYYGASGGNVLHGLGLALRKYTMYKVFMIVGVVVVAVGWAAYFYYDYRLRKEEEKQPKQRSSRLQKTQTEVSDWAKKMAAFKSPAEQRK